MKLQTQCCVLLRDDQHCSEEWVGVLPASADRCCDISRLAKNLSDQNAYGGPMIPLDDASSDPPPAAFPLQLMLDVWSHLSQEICDLTSPILTETRYQDALRLFEAVGDQVGETPGHPLGSLFLLLRDRIIAYEVRPLLADSRSPERLLAWLMAQHDVTTEELAVILDSDQSGVRMLLSGETPMTVTTVRALARHFHVSAEVFLIGR